MDTIKRSCLLLMLLLAYTEYTHGQDVDSWKTYYHNISIGNGIYTIHRTFPSKMYPGLICSLGYGGELSLDRDWSVMPGIRYRLLLGDFGKKPLDGGDRKDYFDLVDFSCQLRYRVNYGNILLVLGVGPMLTIDVSEQFNYYELTPPITEPSINGKRKYKTWDILFTPSISLVLWKHWAICLEAGVGLNNIMIQYPEYNTIGNMHHYYVLFTTGVRL